MLAASSTPDLTVPTSPSYTFWGCYRTGCLDKFGWVEMCLGSEGRNFLLSGGTKEPALARTRVSESGVRSDSQPWGDSAESTPVGIEMEKTISSHQPFFFVKQCCWQISQDAAQCEAFNICWADNWRSSCGYRKGYRPLRIFGGVCRIEKHSAWLHVVVHVHHKQCSQHG